MTTLVERLFGQRKMPGGKEVGKATQGDRSRALAKFVGVGVVLALILLLTSVTSLPVSQAAFPGQNGKIAFTSNQDFSNNVQIYLMDADGSNQTRLTFANGNDGESAWSPDGAKIAFSTNRSPAPGNEGRIWVMDADGSNQTMLTTFNSGKPSWSPDGSKIAFFGVIGGDAEIYVMDADGSNQTNLTSSTGVNAHPSWSPDGSKIAFSSMRDGNWEIYVMDDDGFNQTRLTTTTEGTDWIPDWSPDGSKIAFASNRDGDFEIYVMDADGSDQTPLTVNTGDDRNPAWSPDGTKILFDSDRDGDQDIYVMNANGSNPKNLTNNSTYDCGASWQPLPVPDITPPVVNVSFPSPNGENGWFVTSPVIGSVIADDTTTGGSNVTVINCTGATVGSITGLGTPSASASLTVSAEGVNNVSCTAADSAGNSGVGAGSNNTAIVQIDTVAPAVLITSPADGGSYLLNAAVASGYTCADATSGVATCDGPVASGADFSTSPVGAHAFTVTATDGAGNPAQATNNYNVIYDFSGFFPPVDNPPALNDVKAGRAIPVKFSLNGDQGLNIFATGFPVSQPIACDTSDPPDDVEETTTAGSSSLSYDATTDQYVYVWKTGKRWAGTCRQLIVQLNDGTAHVAYFNFAK